MLMRMFEKGDYQFLVQYGGGECGGSRLRAASAPS